MKGARGRFLFALGLAAVSVRPTLLGAQLRPIESVPWEAVGADGPRLRLGVGFHRGARATLAGVRGDLLELGNVTGTWSLGRAVIEVGGTVARVFSDDSTYAAPVADARPSNGERRVDTGEHRLGAIVLVTPPTSAVDAVLRFGTRLPTTDNEQGLGRDQTDFYGTVGVRTVRAALEMAAETGVAILGTRLARPEQVDALIWAAQVGWRQGRVRLWVEAVGQHDTRRAPELRGLEDLGEARLAAEVGRVPWIRLTVLCGWTFASPELGLLVESGFRL